MNTNNSIIIDPIKKVHGTIFLPGSKSISNRALLLAAQSVGKTRLINLLDCDDVNFMLTALKNLGVKYSFLNNKKICEIHGLGGVIQTKNKLFLSLGNAGTVIRPLTAALSIKFQDVILTGNIRMRKRPISHLIDALRQGGSRIDYIENEKYLPIKLYGGYQGGKISIQGNISSQFLSSILMMAPLAPRDTYITINGILVSKPYIDITLSLMKAFGITVQNNNYCSFYCKGNRLYKSPGDYLIEGDATSASYFLAASAIRGGSVRVVGVGRHSKQGDIHFAHVLEKMGANIYWNDNYIECTKAKNLNSIDMDLSFMPDAAMTLAIVSLFVKNKLSTLRNIYNWRVKESDRLSAMACELRKVGAKVFEGYDYLEITPPKKIKKAKIDTYDDHRIAMCFSLIPLSGVPITIFNPKCVYKTFPDFFKKFLEISIMY